MGPPLQQVKDLKKLNFSTAQFYTLFDGSNEVVPKTAFPTYVSLRYSRFKQKCDVDDACKIDVRDFAAAHIKALTTPAAANRRFIMAHSFKYQDIADVLKENPQLKGRLAKDSDEVPPIPKVDMETTDKALEIKWRTSRETFGDTAKTILDLENRA